MPTIFFCRIKKMTHHNPLARILDNNKLIGLNFDDWFCNIRIVLTSESIEYVLKESKPVGPSIDEIEEEANKMWEKDDIKARCYMLASMSNELQKQHENMDSATSIILHL